jgi:pimeloyl-ACP methyl ester carboxylesterase
MSRFGTIAKVAGVATGVVAGLAGAGYAGERAAAARLRRNPDGDAARALEAPIYIDRRLTAVDGASIYVVEDGEGPPIVFSHGVTNSIRTWFHQLDELPRAGFRAIAYDHRGHGNSVLGSSGHSLENLALDLRTVIEELDVRGAVLVGHSMGGVAVQAFVTQFPEIAAERVAGIVLLSTLAQTPFGSHSTRTKARIEKITNRAPDMSWLWSSPNLGFLLARIGFGKDPQPSHVELVRQMLMECPPETRLDAPRALIGLDLTEQLPDIRMPTLVIVGTADLLTPPAQARQIARLIPGARLEIFTGGGHMLMLERTEALNKMIIDFAHEVGAGPVEHPSLPETSRQAAR